jgi:hypothetical protein
MRDYITIGATPCAQVGEPDYYHKAREECRRFIRLIREKLGPEPEDAHLTITSFSHDLGNYLKVTCYFDTDTPEAIDYVSRCESDAPATWED